MGADVFKSLAQAISRQFYIINGNPVDGLAVIPKKEQDNSLVNFSYPYMFKKFGLSEQVQLQSILNVFDVSLTLVKSIPYILKYPSELLQNSDSFSYPFIYLSIVQFRRFAIQFISLFVKSVYGKYPKDTHFLYYTFVPRPYISVSLANLKHGGKDSSERSYYLGIPENSLISFETDIINIIKAHIDGNNILAAQSMSLPYQIDIISLRNKALNQVQDLESCKRILDFISNKIFMMKEQCEIYKLIRKQYNIIIVQQQIKFFDNIPLKLQLNEINSQQNQQKIKIHFILTISSCDENKKYLESKVNSIPDFPKPGIIFKDLNTIYADPKALNILSKELVKQVEGKHYDRIVSLEARGFIGGSIIAQQTNAGVILVRKPNKLPGQNIVTVTFDLEYKQGETFCVQKDLIDPTKKYLIYDDIIATGGSAIAAIQLLQKCGVPLENIDLLFIAEIIGLGGRENVGKYKSFETLLQFRDD